jgi:hypothetical protein
MCPASKKEIIAAVVEYLLSILKAMCIVLYGFCNKLTQAWRLKTKHIYSFTILEVRNSKAISWSKNLGFSGATLSLEI